MMRLFSKHNNNSSSTTLSAEFNILVHAEPQVLAKAFE
jgi:hypothetical protein